MRMNRLLRNADRKQYESLIEKMKKVCPETMSRKIENANVQQAFMLHAVGDSMQKNYSGRELDILCVGSFEDTAYETLQALDITVHGIDPETDIDLATFKEEVKDLDDVPREFDVIFSTSVIEHVKDDDSFIRDICSLLKEGGVGILTCDFNDSYKDGDKLPYSDERFYTLKDFERFEEILKDNNCKLVGEADWSGEPDFEHDGCKYSFAIFTFEKEK